MAFGGVYSQNSVSWESLLRKASHEPERGLFLKSSERAIIQCQTALVWKELEILFSVWEDWAGKTFLEAKSYILKWLHTEFVACTRGCVSHLFQISPGCTDCPGTRAERHFKDDITAANQAASNSVLTITPISLLGRGIWVIPKKSACSQPLP